MSSTRPFRSDSNGLETPRGDNDETMAPDWSGNQGGQTLWTHYNNKAQHFDDDLVKDLNNTLDTLLLFAGLFSAAVSAIISQTYPQLRPENTESILKELQKPGSTVNEVFTPPPYAIRVNCLLFISLFISMVVALLAILVKQWTRGYQRDLQGVSSPHLLARTRHFRYQGAAHWYFSECVSGLSIIMHISLFIAATGILDLLRAASSTLANICLVVPVLGATVFFGTTFIGVVADDSPYRTPLATGFKRLLKSLRFRFLTAEENDGTEEDLLHMETSGRDENFLVRKKPHLDLDIIIYLLSQSDTSTERGIWDDCFIKLPQLNLLSRQSPNVILEQQEELFRAYRFLTSGCFMEKNNVEGIASYRLKRACYLCSFLAWYLTLQRSPQRRTQLQAYFKRWTQCNQLPQTLRESQSQLSSFIPATRAIGRLDHLIQQDDDNTKCKICDDMYGELKAKYESVDVSVRTNAESRQLMLDTTTFLVKATDCLVLLSSPGYLGDTDIAVGANRIVEVLKESKKAFKLSISDRAEWNSFLEQARDRANDSVWINDALQVFNPTK